MRILCICVFFSLNSFFEDYKFVKAFNLGEYDKAQQILESQLLENPNNPEALYNLADLFYEKKDFVNSAKYYKLAVDLLSNASKKEETYFNLGNSHAQLKEYKEALNDYENVLKINPNNKRAKHNYDIIKKILEDQNKQQNKDNQNNHQNQKNNKNQDQQQNNNKNDNQQNDQDKQDNNQHDKNKDNGDKDNKNNDEQQNKQNEQNQMDKQKQHQNQEQSSQQQTKQNQNKKSNEQQQSANDNKKNESSSQECEKSGSNKQNLNGQQQDESQKSLNAKRKLKQEELQNLLEQDELKALEVLEKQDNNLNKQIVNYLVAAKSNEDEDNNW